MMREISNEIFVGERPLFSANSIVATKCSFKEGESPIKECKDIILNECVFEWKYPVWYSSNISINSCRFQAMARAGIWYSNNIEVTDTLIDAPKNFRRSEDIRISDVEFTDASETLWECRRVFLTKVKAKGDYFGKNSSKIEISDFELNGNYPFDGCHDIVIRNSVLISKDAFWNCENVTIYDSYISGEYIAWNSKKVKFVNCKIESLQGLCYIDGLILENCELVNTTLAFENSRDINATLQGTVDSIFNPISGYISCPHIKELIIEEDKVSSEETKIVCDNIGRHLSGPSWLSEE